MVENRVPTGKEYVEGSPFWSTEEFRRDFAVVTFLAPFVFVVRRSDGKQGSLRFDHHPRVYYNWQEGSNG